VKAWRFTEGLSVFLPAEVKVSGDKIKKIPGEKSIYACRSILQALQFGSGDMLSIIEITGEFTEANQKIKGGQWDPYDQQDASRIFPSPRLWHLLGSIPLPAKAHYILSLIYDSSLGQIQPPNL